MHFFILLALSLLLLYEHNYTKFSVKKIDASVTAKHLFFKIVINLFNAYFVPVPFQASVPWSSQIPVFHQDSAK